MLDLAGLESFSTSFVLFFGGLKDRRILGYAMGAHHDAGLVVAALNMAAVIRGEPRERNWWPRPSTASPGTPHLTIVLLAGGRAP